ncbi:uncharacterized protein LOC128959464 [Oppia nitens]|uniref:uncharacterized protein LOC128959464 n=1 Tax=Oppia nitens TaxID=1686743 RepID=UPI0023DACC28|nr:uncharacterized protein LOC128959464 [Oppia nitens]
MVRKRDKRKNKCRDIPTDNTNNRNKRRINPWVELMAKAKDDNRNNRNQSSLLDPQPWDWDELQQLPQPMEPIRTLGADNWSAKWYNWDTAGRGHDIVWDENQVNMEHYRQLLQQYGYEIQGFIRERKGRHDHHIVNVLRDEPADPSIGKLRGKYPYVCKIVSMGFYKKRYGRRIDRAVQAFRKEAAILMRLDKYNQQNIVKVYDWIDLTDPFTQFPYNYGALIMEVMLGSLSDLIRSKPMKILDFNYCQLVARDIAQALEFIHSRIKYRLDTNRHPILGHDSQPICETFTIVHMAVSPRNILYKLVKDDQSLLPRYVFKLADFEESYVYELDEPAVMPTWAIAKPYLHSHSAAELFESDTSNMLTPPMDMYSLGACIDCAHTVDSQIPIPSLDLQQPRLWHMSSSMKLIENNDTV